MSISETAASVAARAFFYPSLAWNIARNRLQDNWHWWDDITANVILGALPFYSTLEELKELGVTAVVTLNEDFEVFITAEQYEALGLKHLHIPTVDFVFAPQLQDLHKGADFIHSIGEEGGKTYVHCKAGRGRSTTLVLCYLVKYHKHNPESAYRYVRDRRPQVYLAQGQWTAVCEFYLSWRPSEGLSVEDFPYPTFTGPTEGQEDGPAGNNSQAVDGTTPAAAGNGREERETSASSFEVCEADSTSAAVQISASTQQTESDGIVVLNSHGSERSDSELSVSNIAAALSTVRVRGASSDGSSGAVSNRHATTEEVQQGDRGGSRAIEIPRGRSPGPLPGKPRSCFELGSSNGSVQIEPSASSKGSAQIDISSSSKGSIQLEPSGSLPGYVRIAPIRQGSKAPQGPPVMNATLASTGFQPIEDWAAVDLAGSRKP